MAVVVSRTERFGVARYFQHKSKRGFHIMLWPEYPNTTVEPTCTYFRKAYNGGPGSEIAWQAWTWPGRLLLGLQTSVISWIHGLALSPVTLDSWDEGMASMPGSFPCSIMQTIALNMAKEGASGMV